MRETLQDEVSVDVMLAANSRQPLPRRIEWRSREYAISEVGLYHSFRDGRARIHVFSVSDGDTFFRLELNSETLRWLLTEVSDGQAD